MSRPKMPEAQREQIRTKILDAACAILIENGPEQISSRAIAQHLDLTHMGLFTYFPNQAAIHRALAEREQTKFLSQLQIYVEQAEKEDISRVLENTLQKFQNFARENPNLFRLVWVEPEAQNPPRWMQATIELIAGLIRKGRDQGKFTTSDAETCRVAGRQPGQYALYSVSQWKNCRPRYGRKIVARSTRGSHALYPSRIRIWSGGQARHLEIYQCVVQTKPEMAR